MGFDFDNIVHNHANNRHEAFAKGLAFPCTNLIPYLCESENGTNEPAYKEIESQGHRK